MRDYEIVAWAFVKHPLTISLRHSADWGWPMTTSHPMIPTDPSIFEEDSQALAELLVVIIELAQMTFAYPLSVLTHRGEPWLRTGAFRNPRARAACGAKSGSSA